MADKNYDEASSSSQAKHENLESTVEINIKTLDSQIFSFRVNTDMPVLMLKEKIASAVGVPVGQQRLIFRGKVLKDDQLLSAYHVEDGHTLHLVARQPVQTENQPGTTSVGTAGNVDNRGSDPAAGASRNRVGVVGQIAHNVVLGPFNIGDQTEIVMPDLSRIVGSVLSSLGIGSPAITGGVGNSSPTNPPSSSNQASQTVEASGTQNATARTPTENQLPFSPNLFPFQSFNQSQPFHLVTPDSLTTLSTFVARLEQALSLNGYQSSAPSSGENSLRSDMPSSSTGLPTPELLGTVMERTQRLLSGQAAAALSHIAGRLGREGSSTDPAVRGQIQSQAVHIGVAMQHLGALLLELGRTTLMLRMGQSPAESLVNSGPAVYISASGPSPMMVQPALHTIPLFGFSPNSPIVSTGVPGQIGIGDTLRNVNIHIHPGTPVAAGGSSVGFRTTSEGSNAEGAGNGSASGNRNIGGESGAVRGLPSRTVVAAIPGRSPTETSGHVLSVIYPIHVRTQQSNSTVPVPAQGHGPSAELGPPTNEATSGLHSSGSGSIMNDAHSMPTGNGQGGSLSLALSSLPTDALPANDGRQSVTSGFSTVSDSEKDVPCLLTKNVEAAMTNRSEKDVPCVPTGNVEAAMTNRSGGSSSEHYLEIGVSPSDSRKIKSDDVQPSSNDNGVKVLGGEEASTTGSAIDSQESPVIAVDTAANATGLSQSRQPVEDDKPVPLGLGFGGLQPKRRTKQPKSQGKDEVAQGTLGGHDQQSIAVGQQVLQSLVSQADPRAGMGSPAGSGRAQQVHGQGPEFGDALLGLSRGQGGFDISRMFQQMMPVISQALGGGPAAPSLGVEIERGTPADHYSTHSENKLVEKKSQVDVQPVVDRIQHGDSTADVFRAMLESARQLYGGGNRSLDLVNILGSNEELTNEFLEMLRRDIHQRAQSDSVS